MAIARLSSASWPPNAVGGVGLFTLPRTRLGGELAENGAALGAYILQQSEDVLFSAIMVDGLGTIAEAAGIPSEPKSRDCGGVAVRRRDGGGKLLKKPQPAFSYNAAPLPGPGGNLLKTNWRIQLSSSFIAWYYFPPPRSYTAHAGRNFRITS